MGNPHVHRLAHLLRPLLAVVLLCVATGTEAASYPHERPMVLFGGNVGIGLGEIITSEVHSGTEVGFAGALRGGLMVTDNLALSLDLNGWTWNGGGATWFLSNLLLTATWYPAADGPWYFQAGFGLGRIDAEAFTEIPDVDTSRPIPVRAEESGPGFMAAAGYEFRTARNLAIGPQLEFNYIPTGDLVIPPFPPNPETTFEGVSAWYSNLTLALTWYLD